MLVEKLIGAFIVMLLPTAYGHTISGMDSIQKQISKRSTNQPIDQIYENLPRQDIDFINFHLQELTSYNGSDCDVCKNRITYGQSLINKQPNDQHLISLLLFKYCMVLNDNDESECDNVDFFITTNSQNNEIPIDKFDSGIAAATSINFFDNDFIQMLKHINVSSDLTLEYYCFYKDSKSCDLPETPSIDIYDFDSKWPTKLPKHYQEPIYNRTSRETFNVLHISDFHNQLRFEMASEANCSQGLCCLPESYNEDLPKIKNHNFTQVFLDEDPSLNNQSYEISFYPDAYYDSDSKFVKGDYYDYPKYRGWDFEYQPVTTFGSYQCDPPEILLNNSLIHIGQTTSENNYEFSLFTGDIVDHDVVHCNANTTKFAEIRSYKIMKHFLGDLPVFPTLGNHDTFPYGQLPPLKYYNQSNFNDSDYHWNDDLMSKLWTSNEWLPESDQQQIKSHYSGFSTVTSRGLKVISLNSNCYYQKNLWSYIDLETDPDLFGQWSFLIDELIESESKDQRVWILAHIPSGDSDALPIQSKIFAKIIERFSPYTIANIFFGHTHKDQFKVLYDNNEEPVNMAWISQAITPLGPSNPSWRYYEVEDESFNIINGYNYYTKLNETFTNNGIEPEWQYEYNPRSTYDPDGKWPERAPLNATFWNEFVVSKLKNQSNIEFNQMYSNLLHRFAPNSPKCDNGSAISDGCYNSNYCDVTGFLSDEYQKCLR